MADTPNKIILYLAPLRGFTEFIYRNAFERHFGGFDVAVSPFIPTMTAARFKKTHLKDVLPENNHAMPRLLQLSIALTVVLPQQQIDLPPGIK